HLVQLAPDDEPRRLRVDAERRRSLVRAGEDVADVGDRSVGDEDLRPVEDVLVAVAHRRRTEGSCVTTALRLRACPRPHVGAVAQTWQPTLLELFGAVQPDRYGADDPVRA